MALEHFITRRRIVRDEGGREFVCRGPTVATMHLVLGLYALEIVAARRSWDGDGDAAAAVRGVVNTIAKHADLRLRKVLETCVDGDVYSASAGCLAEMTGVCLSLCDVSRTIGGLQFDDDGGSEFDVADEVAGDGPDAQCVAIVRLAREFGCTPGAIVDWPYEAMLDTIDVLAVILPQQGGQNGARPVDPASIPGIGVSDVRSR